MAASGFDTRKRTVILISGFMTDDRVDWLERLTDLWLKLEDCNVIIVTWKEGNRYVYGRAAATTPRVARQIAIFLHYLDSMQADDGGEFSSRIHFIGHSLGAHIGGFLGQDFRGQLGRIVALDPAGPSFDQFGREHRLDPSDARLVEVIHTNGGQMKYASLVKNGAKVAIEKFFGPLVGLDDSARSIAETFSAEGDSVWFGMEEPLGHVDYFANNGKTQPGCTGGAHLCDHGRSHHIYEGMLNHELELREKFSTGQPRDGAAFEQWRKNNRLLAVSAADYAAFASGEALNQHCPAMLHNRDRLNGLADRQRPLCTLPMDQLTPVAELTRELSESYGISFDTSAGPPTQRYYFKTLAAKPFAGDHYLLRLRLERSSVWDKNCALQAEFVYASGQRTTVELDKELRVFSNGRFYGLSLPFVNPNNADARLALDRMLQLFASKNETQTHNNHQLGEDGQELLEQILPVSVTLEMIEQQSQSTLSRWIKGSQPGPKCSLSIDSIQVHPLVGFKRSMFGLYSSQQPAPGDGHPVKTISYLEYKTHKQTKRAWPESLIPDHQRHERRLQLLVVG